MKKLLGKYQNGTYMVSILSDGTKIRMAPNDVFIPAFAENCDVKITDYCNGGCEYCYEGCTTKGKHGDLMNAKFIDTLHPYTEMALNGNDLSHPELIPFLEKLKSKKVIANMTVNQKHFMNEDNYKLLTQLVNDGLIFGLGVSLIEANEEFVAKIAPFKNLVVHVINGIFTEKDYEVLRGKNLKMLILGYKHLRRGNDWFEKNADDITAKQKWLYDAMETLTAEFDVVSFDNLAIEQLEIKRLMSEEDWEEFYMGDDGTVTFYIDMVAGKFAKNSLSMERYDILDSIDEMFDVIVKNNKKIAV